MRRGRVLLVVVIVMVIGVVIGSIEVFARKAPANAASGDNTAATSTAAITKRSLSAQTNVSATLGYAGSYSIVNQAAGNFSQLPAVGDVVESGEVLYEVDGQPVVLLTGSTPAYRTLVAGISGPDAQELNNDLVFLGYGAAALEVLTDQVGFADSPAAVNRDELGTSRSVNAVKESDFALASEQTIRQHDGFGQP